MTIVYMTLFYIYITFAILLAHQGAGGMAESGKRPPRAASKKVESYKQYSRSGDTGEHSTVERLEK